MLRAANPFTSVSAKAGGARLVHPSRKSRSGPARGPGYFAVPGRRRRTGVCEGPGISGRPTGHFLQEPWGLRSGMWLG